MALRQILSKRQQMTNSRGEPLAAGLVHLFEPNTATYITVYADSGLVTSIQNPVRLSGSGRAEIWVSRDCDVRVDDRNGNTITEELNANPEDLGTEESGGLVPNGSFEIDVDANGVPDGWTRTNYTGSTNAIDTTQSTDGDQCFRFTSAGVNGGGELETTDFFPVNGTDQLRVKFDLRSTNAALRNIVSVRWYDISQVFISASSVYDSTSNPTTFATQSVFGTPPGTARFAKLRIIGCDPSTGLAGSTYVDRVEVFYPAVVSGIFGNLEILDNQIRSNNVNGNIDLNPNGTGLVRVNSLDIRDASTLNAGVLANARVQASNVTQHQAALALATSQVTSGTFADARIAASNVTQHQAALALATSQITSGTFADARIAQSNVTQHQAALALAGTQITSGTVADARLSTNVPLKNASNVFTGAVQVLGGEARVDHATNPFYSWLLSGARVAYSQVFGTALEFVNEQSGGQLRLATTGGGAVTVNGTSVNSTALITSGTWADARIAASNVTQHQAALSIAWGQLTSVPATFAPSAHTHAAADIVSGTLADLRIAQSNVTQHQAALSIATTQLTGNMPDARIIATNVTQHQGSLAIGTGQVTSGTFADARIAQTNVTQHQAALALATSQITSGTFADARIAATNVTQHQASINHDALTNYVANRHRLVSQQNGGTATGGADGDIILIW